MGPKPRTWPFLLPCLLNAQQGDGGNAEGKGALTLGERTREGTGSWSRPTKPREAERCSAFGVAGGLLWSPLCLGTLTLHAPTPLQHRQS